MSLQFISVKGIPRWSFIWYLLCFMLVSDVVEAQYVVESEQNASPQYDSPIDITLGTDEISDVLDIGFDFDFFGNTYSEFYMSSNGFITFDAGSGSGFDNQTLPDINDPNNLIAVGWASHIPDYTWFAYETIGDAPNRSLHVNFYIDYYDSGGPDQGFAPPCYYYLDAQLILYETTNIIEMHMYSYDGDCEVYTTQGIENEDGTLAFGLPERNNTIWYTDDEIVRFIPDSYIDLENLGTDPVQCEGNQDIVVRVRNGGGGTIDTFYVDWTWEGVPQDSVAVYATLPPDSTLMVTLGQKTFETDSSYTLTSWTYNPENAPDQNLLNDTLTTIMMTGMQGEFTIGGASPDFVTINDAISAMISSGICDSTIFNIRPGTYPEELNIQDITISDGNLVVFQSESGESEDVIITQNYTSGSTNRLMEIIKTSHLHFKNLTFEVTGSVCATVVYMDEYCADIQFINCQLIGPECNSTTSNGAVIALRYGEKEDLVFSGNTIRNGSYGVYVSPGYPNFVRDLVMTENTIDSFYRYGVYLFRGFDVYLSNNVLYTASSNASGVYANYFFGGAIMESQNISLPNGARGIWIDSYNDVVPFGEDTLYLVNNMINLSGTGTGTMGLSVEYSNNVNVWHNTINNSGTHSGSFGFYANGNTNLDLRNSLITHTGAGKAAWLSSLTSDYNVYYNEVPPLLTDGSDFASLEDWVLASGQDSNSLQVDPFYVSPTDLHVTHGALNSAGDELTPAVTLDIDLESRNTSAPDIGADEFGFLNDDLQAAEILFPDEMVIGDNDILAVVYNVGTNDVDTYTLEWEVDDVAQTPVALSITLPAGSSDTILLGSVLMEAGVALSISANTTMPNGNSDADMTNDTVMVGPVYPVLNGLYTVGGDSPDFPTLTDAFDAIAFGGILDSVDLAVRDGLYAEPIHLTPSANFACDKPIHVFSESLDTAAVIFDNDNQVEPVIWLDGASGITFSYITFKLTPSAFHNTIVIENDAACNRFDHCVIEGRFNTSSTSNAYAAAISYSSAGVDNDFYDCVFRYGSYGLYSDGPSLSTGSEVDILRNTFKNHYYRSLYVVNSKFVHVIGNETMITTAQHSSYDGIFLNGCQSMTLSHNSAYNLVDAGSGIYYTECDGTLQDTTRVFNNYVYAGTPNGLSAVFGGSYSNYIHVSNNTSRSYKGRAAGFSWSAAFRLDNNVFVTTDSNGVVLELLNMQGDNVVSDNNCLYTPGGNIGELNNTQYHSMADWQALGFDSLSLNIDPIFDGLTYKPYSVLLDSIAFPYAHIIDDIEGDPRDVTSPDLGADEFIPLTADAGMVGIIHPTMPFSAGVQPVYVRFYNNGGDTLHSLQFDWEVNGEAQDPFVWSGLLSRGAIYDSLEIGQYEFETYTPYHFKVWVSEPNGMTDLLALNDTIEVDNQYTGLGGVYTIGGEDPDFETITDAVDALMAGGADAPVTFNIRNGMYSENIYLNDFPGSECDRPVIFKSESGDSSLVTITNLGIDAYPITLDGADGVQFKNMTIKSVNGSFRHVVYFSDGSHCNRFEGVTLNGYQSTTTSSAAAVIRSEAGLDTANVFMDSRILDGSYSFYLSGDNSDLTSMVISGNVLEPYYRCIYLDDFRGATITHNHIIVDDRTSSRGIEITNSPDLVEISYNRIEVPLGQYGIYLSNIDNQPELPGRIFNNFISVGGTSVARGIYLTGSAYHDIFHNSIHVYSTNTSAGNTVPIYVTSSPNVHVLNNATKNSGVGYSVYVNNSADYLADHNTYFTNGSTFGYWNGGGAETTFLDWQTASEQDSNSIEIDPNFMSDTDLHTFLVILNEAGDPVAGIADDIDGAQRDSLPDIGADEFDPLPNDDAGIFMFAGPHIPFGAGSHPVQLVMKNFGGNTLTSVMVRWTVNGIEQTPIEWTGSLPTSACDTFSVGTYAFDELVAYNIDAWTEMPNDSIDADPENDLFSTGTFYVSLSGVYTVGGFAPDFNLVSEFETILNSAGVVGDVTFSFRPGTYSESMVLSNFPKSSYDYSVLLTSETGDSTDVTLTQTANGTALIELNDAHKITFSHLTLVNTKGHVFKIQDGSSQITIAHNYLETQESISASRYLIYSANTTEDSISILNNLFHHGYYGIYLFGGDYEKGHVISGNTFTGKYHYCIYIRKFDSLLFSDNHVTPTSTNNIDVYMRSGVGPSSILRNVVIGAASNISVYFADIDNTTSTPSLFANNYIFKSGSSGHDAVVIEEIDKVDIDFNSVYNANNHTGSAALFTKYNTDHRIRNNILYSVNGAAFHGFGTMPVASDYNLMFTLGDATCVQDYTPYTTLADYVSATGSNGNSLSVDPLFIDSNSPAVAQYLADGSGLTLSGLDTDIYGTNRTSPPDMGAAEFTPVPFDVKVSHVVTPVEGCGLSDEEELKIALVNMGSSVATGFDVAFDFDDQVTTENIGALEVPPGDTLIYTFTATLDVSAYGIHDLPVWIVFMDDTNSQNDSIVHTIENLEPLNTSPGNLNPVDGTTGLENQVSLSWAPVPNAIAYDLYVWPMDTEKPASPTYGGVNIINKLVTGLSYGTSYWWQVHAISSCNEETVSDTSVFSVRHLPDLIVESITIPPTAFSEQTISVEWVTKNTGDGSTVPGTWYENIYLSPDPTYNSFDPLLTSSSSLNSLNPDQSYSHSADVVIPQGSNGLYYIIVKTDHYNGVKETVETNNTTYSVSQINITLSPPPDLLVTEITSPLISFSGESVNITYTVQNLGSGVTTESIWKDRITLVPAPGNDDGISAELGTKTHVGALLPDSSYTVTTSVDIPENIFGDYQFLVYTDYLLDVFEFASEDNNTLLSDVIEVVLTPPVDLVPDSLATPDTMSLYQTYPVTYRINNEGGSSPTVSHTDRYYVSQSPVYNTNFLTHLGYAYHNPGLMPGEYNERTVEIKLTGNYSGEYYIYVVTDYNDRINEYEFENNNILRSDPIFITRPDLIPDSLLHPDMVMSGSTFDLTTEFINSGPGYYTGTFKNRYYLSDDDELSTMTDVLLSFRTVNNATLDISDTVSNTFTVNLPQDQFGSKYLIVAADVTEVIHESNEVNNTLASPITVFEAPHPDLVASALVSPDTIQAGIAFQMSYVLTNEGDVPLDENATDSIFLSFSPTWDRMTAVPIGTKQTALLDTNETQSYTLSVESEFDQNPNEYYIYIVSDATDAVYEGLGESNNILRSDLVVLLAYPDIDIAVDTLYGLPDTLTSGESYNVHYTVTNLSGAPTYYAGWTDRFYFSTDSIFSAEDDLLISSVAYAEGHLGSGASENISTTLSLPDGLTGDYYVFVEADSWDVNEDINRSNNVNAIRMAGAAKKLHTKLALYPDLQPTSFSLPVEIVSGQYFTITSTVKNFGAGIAGQRTDKIFISANNVIDQGDVSISSLTKPALGSMQTQQDTVSVFVPANYSGNYFIIYSVDHGNGVYEHNQENNNIFLSSIVATPPPPADLIVRNVLVPDSVLAGETAEVTWETKNTGTNPAIGVFREIVYLSSDTTWQLTDEVIGIWDGNVNLGPGAHTTKTVPLAYNNVTNADYHTLILTDARNNIPESNEDNNYGFSYDMTNVDIREIFFDQTEESFLSENVNRYYKILVDADEAGRNILVTLRGDSLIGVNQMYIKYEAVPTPADHDYAYNHPFSPHQEIMIRNAQPGYYYIMINGFKVGDDSPQSIEVLARLLQMEILSVSPGQGGNKGYTTMEIFGSDLINLKLVHLLSNDSTNYFSIPADTFIVLEDGVRVVARFNLEGQPTGQYHVQCIRTGGWAATLRNSFDVIEGEGPDLQLNWDFNPKVYNPRSTTLFQIKVDVENRGDADAVDRYIRVGSPSYDNPVYYTLSDYYNGISHAQLVLVSEDLNGFPGVLRPGGRRTFYVIGRIEGTQGFSIHYDK